MREIKFRGRVTQDVEFDGEQIFKKGEWVYGNLVRETDGTPFIMGDMEEVDNEITLFDSWVRVDEESVGQYTGLKDKNGKEIFEGDIVNMVNDKKEFTDFYRKLQVYWCPVNGHWKLGYRHNSDLYTGLFQHGDNLEIIGNIYENPELIK